MSRARLAGMLLAATTATALALPATAVAADEAQKGIPYHDDHGTGRPDAGGIIAANWWDPVLVPGSATPACPDTMRTAEFDDVPWSATHARAVDCLAWWGISVGGNDFRFGLVLPVQRGQNASFLARALDHAGLETDAAPLLPDVPADNVHAGAIGRLVDTGIARLHPDGSFRPSAPLRRDDMAVTLVAAHDRITGVTTRPAAAGRFADLADHPDAVAIEQAAELGFTSGVDATTFDPSGTVTRGQMASFVTRLLDRLVTDGTLQVPDTASWGALPPGRNRYLPLPTAPEGSYVFSWPSDDGLGIRWNPCKPVEVYANYTDAPAHAEAALKAAVAKLGTAMATAVTYRGTSPARAVNEHPEQLEPGAILVSWPPSWESSAAAWGGWSGRSFIDGGYVTVSQQPFSQSNLTQLLMHELGHAVGLGHTSDAEQIMYPMMMYDRPDWGAGDLAGLARAGRGGGCAPSGY